MQNFIGQSLGRYHILEQLGEGGMATVYKAYDTRLERDVAVKVIRRGAFPPDQLERILKRFDREAKALARLSQPNIVGVIDYGDYEGLPYLVMEYLPGGTLKQRLGNPLPWQEAASLLLPIARALHYAHQLGIVHRDVKPSNILLTQSGDPMLTDFGIAKLLDIEETHTLTGTGVGVGTPEYMSPEQGIGIGVDGRADIYSLGIIFYELVTGRKPYTADTPLAVIIKQINEPLPRPSRLVHDLPEKVERILLKALAKKPENRYPDMSAFAVALEILLDNEEHVSEKTFEQDLTTSSQSLPLIEKKGIRDDLATGETETGSTSGTGHGDRARSPRLVWLALACGAGLVCLGLFILGYIFYRNDIFGTSTSTGTPTLSFPTPVDSNSSITITPSPEISKMLSLESSLTASPNKTDPQVSLDGMDLLLVPAGNFIMGNDNGQANEKPAHTVWLDTFRIDKTEITNGMYEKCVQAGRCRAPLISGSYSRSSYYGDPTYADYPVIAVLWENAKAYCSWAGQRLPSEAEWEKAARGTEANIWPWGNEFFGGWVNYFDRQCPLAFASKDFSDDYADTAPVGSYPEGASPYGALDMAGNVWEWVNDWYGANYYSASPSGNPQGPASGMLHSLRGGSWGDLDYQVRTTWRPVFIVSPGLYTVFGFRCAQSVNP